MTGFNREKIETNNDYSSKILEQVNKLGGNQKEAIAEWVAMEKKRFKHETNTKIYESITIDDNIYMPIYSFDVAHLGWDCDTEGWVAQDSSGNKVIISTNHWRLNIVSKEELAEKIKEYKKWIFGTEKALELLEGNLE